MNENFEQFDYESDDDTAEPVPTNTRNKRGPYKRYRIVSKHATAEEALETVDSEYLSYSKKREIELANSTKIEYRCNQVKVRGLQCASSIYLLYHDSSSEVSIFQAMAEHTHDQINSDQQMHGIPVYTKEIIFNYIERETAQTAREIVAQLELDKESDPKIYIPTYLQINNLKANNHSSRTKPNFSFGDLLEVLKEKSVKIAWANVDDEAFVFDYQVKVDDDDMILDGPPIDNRQFRFAISTSRLPKVAAKHRHVIQADSTYKLIWQGNPVQIAGISDKSNRFHPILLTVCSNEDENDFNFLFSSFNKGISLIGE